MDFGQTPPIMEESRIQSPPGQEMAGVQQIQDVCEHLTVTSDRIVKKVGEDLQQDCKTSEVIELSDTESVNDGAEDVGYVWDAAELEELAEIENMIVQVEASLKNTEAYTLLKLKSNKNVTGARKENQKALDVWELHIHPSDKVATRDGEGKEELYITVCIMLQNMTFGRYPSEIDRPAGKGSSASSASNISLPTMSTVGPKDSCLPISKLQQMSLPFPNLQRPKTSLPFKCANYDPHSGSRVEGDGGNSCCLTYCRQYREYQRMKKKAFLTKQMSRPFPGRGPFQDEEKVDDDNIQNVKERSQTLKRKIGDASLCHPAKRQK